MRKVDGDDLTDALVKVAEREDYDDAQGWRFQGTMEWHPDGQARRIARFCLMLGQPVSDIMTTYLFGALVDEVAALQPQGG